MKALKRVTEGVKSETLFNITINLTSVREVMSTGGTSILIRNQNVRTVRMGLCLTATFTQFKQLWFLFLNREKHNVSLPVLSAKIPLPAKTSTVNTSPIRILKYLI